MNDQEIQFIEHLHNEKISAQETRSKYVIKKLVFATVLLGAGSSNISNYDFEALLYIVPFLAIVFDLYILGEDYGIKRLGIFLKETTTVSLEEKWEIWVHDNRDKFSAISMPFLTSLICVSAYSILYLIPQAKKVAVTPEKAITSTVIFILTIGVCWGLYFYYKKLKTNLITQAEATLSKDENAADSLIITNIEQLLQKSNDTLSLDVLKEIEELFLHCAKSKIQQDLLQHIYQYQSHNPIHTPPNDLQEIHEQITRFTELNPQYSEWITVKTSDDQPTVFISDWLHNIIGINRKASKKIISS